MSLYGLTFKAGVALGPAAARAAAKRNPTRRLVGRRLGGSNDRSRLAANSATGTRPAIAAQCPAPKAVPGDMESPPQPENS